MNIVEIVGLMGSFLIVFSMVFKTTEYKGTIAMRIINSAGSIFFIVYGFVLPAISSGITNSILLILNIFYLIKEIRDHKKEQSSKE